MKVLCASISGPGHAHPMTAVARALVRRGHDVTLASGAQHAGDAERAGATFWELPISRGSPRHALEPYLDAEDMARMMAPGVASLAPDVAVVDLLTLGPSLATEMCGVRHATLSIHPLHLPSPSLPPFGWGHAPGRGILRWRDDWMRTHATRDHTGARDALNVARGHLGLPSISGLDAQLSPDLILVATLPSLEIARPDWPARAHVIGPCLWDANGVSPELPPGDEPLVLIASTTAHDDQAAMMRAALRAVAKLGVRAFVTTGPTDQRFAVPPRTRIVESASHDALLPHCAAVVCSGGHGIVARSLSNGVPLVIVPGHGDQRENGYRVERAGAGVRVMRPKARAVRRALEKVLTDKGLRDAAFRMRSEASSMDGPIRAAELIEHLATKRPARA